jgi:hypothetical protein
MQHDSKATGPRLWLYFIFGGFASIFVILASLAIRDEPLLFVFASFVFLAVMLCLRLLRLEITDREIEYRSLFCRVVLPFEEIQRAYFEGEAAENVAFTVARFKLQTRDGKISGISLKCFPLPFVADLFTALERHKIPLQVPDFWHAQYLMEQVREQQVKNQRSLA